MSVKIRDIRVICTAPEGINLVVVKIETNQPGLYGLGCATFAYRHLTVKHRSDERESVCRFEIQFRRFDLQN